MFQPHRYAFIPPLEKRHIPIAALWIVVIVIIALIGSQGASASSIGMAATPQTPYPTPTPRRTATPQPVIGSHVASDSPTAFGSPLQSPLPTPTPQLLIVSFSPAAGSYEVPRHTTLSITFGADWITAPSSRAWRSIRRSAAR